MAHWCQTNTSKVSLKRLWTESVFTSIAINGMKYWVSNRKLYATANRLASFNSLRRLHRRSLLGFAWETGLPSPNICRSLVPTPIGETESADSGSVPSGEAGESGESPWPRFEIPAVPFTSSESQRVILGAGLAPMCFLCSPDV